MTIEIGDIAELSTEPEDLKPKNHPTGAGRHQDIYSMPPT